MKCAGDELVSAAGTSREMNRKYINNPFNSFIPSCSFTQCLTFVKQSSVYMQSLVEQLRFLSAWHFGYTIGLVVLTAVLLHVMLQLYGYSRRLNFEKQQLRLARQEMELSIKAAML